MEMKKIFQSEIWFLAASVIFLFAGFRFYLKEDFTGALIFIIVGILFLINFIGRYISKNKNR
jgi:NhaP-type Na+/H+ or K+/H+ antiporter